MELGDRIIEILKKNNEGLKARKIASLLNEDKSQINSWLYKNRDSIVVENDYVWKLKKVANLSNVNYHIAPYQDRIDRAIRDFEEMGTDAVFLYFSNICFNMFSFEDGKKIVTHDFSGKLTLVITFELTSQSGYVEICHKRYNLDDDFFCKYRDHPEFASVAEWRKKTAERLLKVPLGSEYSNSGYMYLSYEILQNGCISFERKTYTKIDSSLYYFDK